MQTNLLKLKPLDGYAELPCNIFPFEAYDNQLDIEIKSDYNEFKSDVLTFSFCYDYIKEIGLAKNWGRHLDIGRENEGGNR